MTLVEELRGQGITLQAVGDRLRFRGPAELITPALWERLAAHKAELLAQLRRQDQAADERPVNAGSVAQEPPLPAPLRVEPPFLRVNLCQSSNVGVTCAKPPAAPDMAPEPAGAAQALRLALLQARDWRGLVAVLEHVQGAFEQGELTEEEAEVLAAIAAQEAQVLPELADEERLGDLLRRQPVVRLRSRLLGEEILLAAEGAQVPAGGGLVVYRERELRQVVGRPPEEVKAIHRVKKALDGEVVEQPVPTVLQP